MSSAIADLYDHEVRWQKEVLARNGKIPAALYLDEATFRECVNDAESLKAMYWSHSGSIYEGNTLFGLALHVVIGSKRHVRVVSD